MHSPRCVEFIVKGLCFGDELLCQRRRGIWKRELLHVLRNEAASASVKFVVKAVVVKFLYECGVPNSSRQPKNIRSIPFGSEPVAVTIDY